MVVTIIGGLCFLILLLPPVYNNQCNLPECYEEAKRLMASINDRVDACEDFVEFACGKQFPLFERLSVFNGTGIVQPTAYHLRLWWMRRKLQALLDEPLDDNDERGFRLAKMYWQSCKMTNTEDLLAGVRLLFKQLGGWPAITDAWNDSHFSWMEFSKCSRLLGFLPSMFIHIGVNVDDVHQQWSPNDTIKLTIERPVHGSRLVGENVGYLRIAKFLTESSIPDVMEMEDAVKLGNQLEGLECGSNGEIHMTEMTIEKLSELYPIVNWMEYLSGILTTGQAHRLSSSDYVIADTCFLSWFNNVFQYTDKRVQANYAFSTIIDDLFRLIRPELALSFTGSQREVEEICFESTATIFKKALDLAIVKQVDEKTKEKVSEIEQQILDKIFISIFKIPWMDYETQENIVNKMGKLSFINLSPDGIFNDKYFSRLELLQTDAIQIYFREINVFLVDHYYLQAGRARNRYVFHGHMGESVSFLEIFSPSDMIIKPDLLANRVYVPAASVLARKFHFSRQLDFLNYASVGREIATALGSHIYQKNRPIHPNFDSPDNTWWSASTSKQFISRESCYTITTGQAGRELHSASFVFALIGAAEIAYKTIFDTCESDSCMTTLPNLNYTPQQLFWINAVISDCDDNLKYRYNTMVSNIEAFSRDFNCRMGSMMNKRNKCTFFL